MLHLQDATEVDCGDDEYFGEETVHDVTTPEDLQDVIDTGLTIKEGVDASADSTKSYFVESFVTNAKIPQTIMNLLFVALGLMTAFIGSCAGVTLVAAGLDEVAQLYLITSCTVAEHVHRYGHHRLCSHIDPQKLALCIAAATNDPSMVLVKFGTFTSEINLVCGDYLTCSNFDAVGSLALDE